MGIISTAQHNRYDVIFKNEKELFGNVISANAVFECEIKLVLFGQYFFTVAFGSVFVSGWTW